MRLEFFLTGDFCWHDVATGLPEENKKVLCHTISKKGAENFVFGTWYNGHWYCGMNNNVVAWSAIPLPPGGGGNNE